MASGLSLPQIDLSVVQVGTQGGSHKLSSLILTTHVAPCLDYPGMNGSSRHQINYTTSTSNEQPQAEQCITTLSKDGNTAVNNEQAADLLGWHYHEVSRLSFSVEERNIKIRANRIVHGCRSNTHRETSIFNRNFRVNELEATIGDSCLYKSPGPDGIHRLTNLASAEGRDFLDIINCSWNKGQLPRYWRRATERRLRNVELFVLSRSVSGSSSKPNFALALIIRQENGSTSLYISLDVIGEQMLALTDMHLTNILEYNVLVYCSASVTNLQKLERVQLSAARIITGLRNTFPKDIVLFEADLQPLSLRRRACLRKYYNKLRSLYSRNRTSAYFKD
ncbi:hypothetical protein TNCV_4024911 [Trichonephila clavipes]|uniref:Uncharacterized protein n=1 Tax=Trichonephila clavipes TaxID=2585209 RepID=A0A8X7BJN0_TRICX|nr:hypothetical protein TNCV_4024911 [Trichonephila clavipes]